MLQEIRQLDFAVAGAVTIDHASDGCRAHSYSPGKIRHREAAILSAEQLEEFVSAFPGFSRAR